MSLDVRIDFNCAPGDLVVLTAAVRDLKLSLGDEVRIQVSTNKPHVFERNPYLYPGPFTPTHRAVIDYQPWARSSQAGRRLHFLAAMHEILGTALSRTIPLTKPTPDLHLPATWLSQPPVTGRYWVMLAGGKTDMTVKHWYFHRYQAVVNVLRESGISVVQTGKASDIHLPLANVLNLVGWGGLAELFWLIKHADGVICPITCAMHVAAAFDKPCVVLAGGREEPWWEAYTNEGQFPTTQPVPRPHVFLHTLGKFDCCEFAGCWRQKVSGGPPEQQCLNVVRNLQQLQPACLDAIDVGAVINGVLSYYELKHLPPIHPADHTLRFIAEDV